MSILARGKSKSPAKKPLFVAAPGLARQQETRSARQPALAALGAEGYAGRSSRMEATAMRDLFRRRPAAPALFWISAALAVAVSLSAGCGRRQSAGAIVPAYESVQAKPPSSASPLKDAVVVLLPLELRRDIKEINVDVPDELKAFAPDDQSVVQVNPRVKLVLAEQHRRALRDMGMAAKVYSSLTEAERDNPSVAPLMIRGVVQEYAPKHQKRWGETARVMLDAKIRYDVWNPRRKGLVTLWIDADPSVAFVEFQTPGGLATEQQVADKLAELLQREFEKFNNALSGNREVVAFAGQ